MRRILTFIILLFMSSWSFAQQGLQLIQAAPITAQGSMLTAQQGITSLFGNPAGLSSVDHLSFLVTGESRFLGTGITSGGAGVGIPTNAGTIGLGVSYFGIQAFNEQQVQLSFSKKLFKKLALSVRAYLQNASIADYGSAFFLSGDLGLQAYLTDELTLGFLIVNPAQQGIIEGSELPTLFHFGAYYDFGKTFSFGLEVEKGLAQNQDIPIDQDVLLATTARLNVKSGINYRPSEKVSFYLGIQTLLPSYSFGVSFKPSKKFWIDTVASYHEILGFSPGVTIRFINYDK